MYSLIFVGRHYEISINFVIQFQECLLGFIIETIDTDLDCFCLVSKDAVCLDDMDQSAGGDNLIDTAVIEGLADDVCPICKTLAELSVVTEGRENLLFSLGSSDTPARRSLGIAQGMLR